MASGTCRALAELRPEAALVLAGARRAVLATLRPDGSPHVIPVCWARRGEDLVTALDHTPKSDRELGRVRNLKNDPRASMLFDRYSDSWEELGWVMVSGTARLEPPGWAARELAERYEQYRAGPPGGATIALRPQHISWWTWG